MVETSANQTEKVVSNDASTSSSSEPVQTIATNSTEVVESGTSTQIESTNTRPSRLYTSLVFFILFFSVFSDITLIQVS